MKKSKVSQTLVSSLFPFNKVFVQYLMSLNYCYLFMAISSCVPWSTV